MIVVLAMALEWWTDKQKIGLGEMIGTDSKLVDEILEGIDFE